MITRCYADNYCCLSAFNLELDNMSVLMGPNGAGKTTVFRLLEKLRDFILGLDTSVKLFPTSSLTRWEARDIQTFELDIRLPQGLYSYCLRISHAREQANNKVVEESLKFDGKPLFSMDSEFIHLFNDNHDPGPLLQTDWHVSGISRIQARQDNKKLIAFRQAMERTIIVAPVPDNISAISNSKSPVLFPKMDCSNFADWLHNIITAEPTISREAEAQLSAGAMPGLFAFSEVPLGDAKLLKCVFKIGGAKHEFRLDELSSGQIALTVLETVVAMVNEKQGVLLVDEPGNFMALSEIQNLLTRMLDGVTEDRYQVVMTAHHPMAVNYLAASHGIWVERDAGGPTRSFKVQVKDEVKNGEAGISIADLIQRGWLSGLGLSSK
jgi:predicted ATPase